MRNKKMIFVFVLMMFALQFSHAQNDSAQKFTVYHAEANVVDSFAMSIQKAVAGNKHILLEIGGNWCKWCRAFYKFTKTDAEIDSILKADYVVMHVNYSKENKNLPFLETLEYPQRFGFPVFVVLNAQGQRLHTQSSWYLEDGNKDTPGYDREKTIAFLKDWNSAALDPKKYEDDKK